jgi:uncharacterized DUF497 family protein
MNINFEWNATKAALNKKKHSVSFDEAKTVFFDENAIVIDDPEHSDDEARFVILGISAVARLLVVCHCFRQNDSVIRIISARKATKRESMQYYGGE